MSDSFCQEETARWRRSTHMPRIVKVPYLTAILALTIPLLRCCVGMEVQKRAAYLSRCSKPQGSRMPRPRVGLEVPGPTWAEALVGFISCEQWHDSKLM